MKEIRIHGRGGQGAVTAARMLAETSKRISEISPGVQLSRQYYMRIRQIRGPF